jgi:hypothetical protein
MQTKTHMPTTSQARNFDLNIKEILKSWEPCHAVRELIANALDEQTLTGTQDVEISQVNRSAWCIRDFGRGLKYEHFAQNESLEKLKNSEKVIGKFGMGLKDAVGVLHRHGVTVRFRSKFGDITFAQKSKHGFSDISTLHAVFILHDERAFVGTEVVLDGITPEDMERAKAFFLRFSDETILDESRLGAILKKDATRKGRIYVVGLLIAEEDNFLFSYNITSLTKRMKNALNRERTNVGRTAYSDRIKEMLLESNSGAVAAMLAEELVKIERGTNCEEVKRMDVAVHACKILNAEKNVLFVSPSQIHNHGDTIDHAKSDKFRIIAIPDNIRHSIRGVCDVAGNLIRDLSVYQSEWSASFTFEFVDYKRLRKAEQAVFDKLGAIASLVGGLPKAVKAIRLSETMRPNFLNGDHTDGLWDEESASIIVKRDQLRSLQAFAGTLLHEIAHARSGSADVTRDFENELTEMLGLIAALEVSGSRKPPR